MSSPLSLYFLSSFSLSSSRAPPLWPVSHQSVRPPKPNLLDYIPGGARINTHPLVVPAAGVAFDGWVHEGVVAEGPGHQRDTHLFIVRKWICRAVEGAKCSHSGFKSDETREGKIGLLRPNRSGTSVVATNHSPLGLCRVLRQDEDLNWSAASSLSLKNHVLWKWFPAPKYGWPKKFSTGKEGSGAGVRRRFVRDASRRSILLISPTVSLYGWELTLHGVAALCCAQFVLADDPLGREPRNLWLAHGN